MSRERERVNHRNDNNEKAQYLGMYKLKLIKNDSLTTVQYVWMAKSMMGTRENN